MERAVFPGPEGTMLLTIGIILVICWALGFLAFHVTASFIHLLVVLGLIFIVVHFFRSARAV
jgi:hypothetical protein